MDLFVGLGLLTSVPLAEMHIANLRRARMVGSRGMRRVVVDTEDTRDATDVRGVAPVHP
jgi:hypothetical protein